MTNYYINKLDGRTKEARRDYKFVVVNKWASLEAGEEENLKDACVELYGPEYGKVVLKRTVYHCSKGNKVWRGAEYGVAFDTVENATDAIKLAFPDANIIKD